MGGRPLSVLAVAAASLALAADALACTCAPVVLSRDLPRAEGAVVGTVLERRQSGDEARYLLRVEQAYKGDLTGRVEVLTPAGGAACGLDVAVGERIGLLLDREAAVWRSGLCSRVDPAEFLELTNVPDGALPEVNWGGYLVGGLVLGAGAFFLLRRLRNYRALR